MVECTAAPVGLGSEITDAEVRFLDGRPEGLHFMHPCIAGKRRAAWVPFKPAWSHGWDVISIDPLTLSPSILCRTCGLHGFIRDGKWVSA